MRLGILIWRFVPSLTVATLFATIDFFQFHGMCLSGLVLVVTIVYFPILIYKSEKTKASVLILMTSLTLIFELSGAYLLNEKIVSTAYKFRREIILNNATKSSSAIMNRKWFLGYTMLYIDAGDNSPYINITLFNYKKRLLEIKTGALRAPIADD